MPRAQRRHVVILGTGTAVREVVENQSDRDKYTIISPRDHFLYNPLLASAMGGLVTREDICTPVKAFLAKDRLEYIEGTATSVNHSAKTVSVNRKNGDVTNVNYDILVVAVGGVVASGGVPGIYQHAYMFRDWDDYEKLIAKMWANFSEAMKPNVPLSRKRELLTFVVVGGGPTGVELICYFCEFLNNTKSPEFVNLKQYVSFTLIDKGIHLVGKFGPDISESVSRNLRAYGVTLYLRTTVNKVTPDNIVITPTGAPIKVLMYGIVIWTAGVAENPLHEALCKGRKEQEEERLQVDSNLSVQGMENVLAMGDCVDVQPNWLEENVDALYSKARSFVEGAGTGFLKQLAMSSEGRPYPQLKALKHLKELQSYSNMSAERFKEYLAEIDGYYVPCTNTFNSAVEQGLLCSEILNGQPARASGGRKLEGSALYIGFGKSAWLQQSGRYHFGKVCDFTVKLKLFAQQPPHIKQRLRWRWLLRQSAFEQNLSQVL